MLEGLRGYVQLATGLTEVTAAKARDAAMALVNQGMQVSGTTTDVVGSVQELADDLVTSSKENREMLVGMIRTEVDRAVGRMGFVREDELAALRARVERLEREKAATAPTAPSPEAAPKDAGDADTPPVKVKKKVVPE
jgi:polyhydroxyalkanoate synthesis regulator phasin